MTYSISFGFYIHNPNSKYRNQIDSIDYRMIIQSCRRSGKQHLTQTMLYGMARPADGHALGGVMKILLDKPINL